MRRCKGVLLAGMLVLSMSVPVYADKSVVVKVEAPADTTDYYMTVDSGGVGVDIYPSTDEKGEKLNDKTVKDGTVLHIEGETEKNGETWGYTEYNGRYGYVPLEELLARMPVERLLLPEIQDEYGVRDRLLALARELDIPVFHDDQHGTAIVVTAALINALRVVNKKMEDVHIVLNGPGAAGTAIIKMLMTAGAKDIVAVDQFGTLYKGCNSAEAHKNWLGEVTNPRQIKGGLKEALEGADVFIGVSKPGILTTELCKTMNKDAIVFAMANPTPEIMPDEAKAGGVRVMATGRSDFPNQVNNVLCFPGLFKGALSVRARDINNEMKLAAAYAIADLITDADRSEENIIPGAFDPRVAEAVANAVAKAARETGVARL